MNIRVSEPEESCAASVVPSDSKLVEAGIMRSPAAADEEAPPIQTRWPAVMIGFAILVTLIWNGALLWLVSRMLFF